MSPVQALCLVLTALIATLVVFIREPSRQVLAFSLYGMVLTALFMTLQAPDVAFSELGVGTVAVPLMLLAALGSTSERRGKKGGDT